MTTKVIIVGRETVLSSLCKDVTTLLLFSVLIGIGILAGSSAMQWAGFVIVAAIVLQWSTETPKDRTLTIDDARKNWTVWNRRSQMTDTQAPKSAKKTIRNKIYVILIMHEN